MQNSHGKTIFDIKSENISFLFTTLSISILHHQNRKEKELKGVNACMIMIKSKKYRKTIKDILKVIIKEHKPKKVILFGSCLSSSNPHDIDMLIVKNTDKDNFLDRWVEIQSSTRKILNGISFEPFVITPKEFEKETKRKHPFLVEILKNGEVIYEEKFVS